MRSLFVVFASLLIVSVHSKPFLKQDSTSSFSGSLTSFKESLSSALNAGASKFTPSSVKPEVEEVEEPQTTPAPVVVPLDIEVPEIEEETIDIMPYPPADIEKVDLHGHVIVDFNSIRDVIVDRKDINEKEEEIEEKKAREDNTITISKTLFVDAMNNFFNTLFTTKFQLREAASANFVEKFKSTSDEQKTSRKVPTPLKAEKSIRRNDAADHVIDEFTKKIQRSGSKKYIIDATDILETLERNVDEDYELDA